MTAARARLCVCCGAPVSVGALCDMHEQMRRRVARIVAERYRRRGTA